MKTVDCFWFKLFLNLENEWSEMLGNVFVSIVTSGVLTKKVLNWGGGVDVTLLYISTIIQLQLLSTTSRASSNLT